MLFQSFILSHKIHCLFGFKCSWREYSLDCDYPCHLSLITNHILLHPSLRYSRATKICQYLREVVYLSCTKTVNSIYWLKTISIVSFASQGPLATVIRGDYYFNMLNSWLYLNIYVALRDNIDWFRLPWLSLNTSSHSPISDLNNHLLIPSEGKLGADPSKCMYFAECWSVT